MAEITYSTFKLALYAIVTFKTLLVSTIFTAGEDSSHQRHTKWNPILDYYPQYSHRTFNTGTCYLCFMEGKHHYFAYFSNPTLHIFQYNHGMTQSRAVMLNVDCVECSPPGWILQEKIR